MQTCLHDNITPIEKCHKCRVLLDFSVNNREAARQLSVSHTSVNRWRSQLEQNVPTEEPAKRLGKDDKMYQAHPKVKRKKISAQEPSDCDYDWDNVKEIDFGDPTEAYRRQAEHYRREAIHLAEAYPLRSNKVNASTITEAEIQAMREVAQAWSDATEDIVRRKQRSLKCA